MRDLMISAAAALVLVIQTVPAAQAVDNAVIRKNNDAGASSAVIRKDEPPLTAMPNPREGQKPTDHEKQ